MQQGAVGRRSRVGPATVDFTLKIYGILLFTVLDKSTRAVVTAVSFFFLFSLLKNEHKKKDKIKILKWAGFLLKNNSDKKKIIITCINKIVVNNLK